jgi:redox-sensitive bicupin YhaK (pirin superfamily)
VIGKVHRAGDRGIAEHGWLHSRHTFSFAQYHDPERMGFGALRVINDDIVEPGAGFDTHEHENMEIISVPLAGVLRHRDSEGNVQIIRQGEVQIMSAGTGIAHSEYNASDTESVNFLQIWVLPKQRNIEPRYGQKEFPAEARENCFQTVVAPDTDVEAVWINQEAWFSLADFSAGHSGVYDMNRDGNGAYVFVIDGEIEISDERLARRDGAEIDEVSGVEIKAVADSEILLIEVPV